MIVKEEPGIRQRKTFNLIPGQFENTNSSNSPRAARKHLAKALLDMRAVHRLATFGNSSIESRNRLSARLPAWVKYRGVYNTFEEALATAPKNVPVGFDYPAFANHYAWLVDAPRAGDYPAMFWTQEALKTGSKVFDYGGNVGISFFAWRNHIQYPADISWMVQDVPSIIENSREFVRSRGETRVHFTNDFADAADSDTFLSCGCLQFVEPRLNELLSGLRRLPRHIIINRLPLHQTHDFVTLQNIRWQQSAYHVFQYDRFVSELEALGYTLVDLWSDGDSNCWIPFFPDYSLESFCGLYLRRDS